MQLKIVKNSLKPSINRINKRFDQLPKAAFAFWRKITPKRTGNAKRKTRLQGNTIRAGYDYAVPLDRGRSRQAPRGMSKPTEEYIDRRVKRKILRK